MKKILNYLFEHKSLSREQAKEVLHNISNNVFSDAEIAAFITVYLMRSITIEELQGFRDALMELCVPVDLHGQDVIDIVGTGGDGKNTFNISTLSAIVVAVIVAAAAPFALPGLQQDASSAFATSSTRVGDPGHNLVGSH